MFFDNSGPMAYHTMVHDGFGYLYQHHDIGPGYNYLGKCSFFCTYSPLSGHIGGGYFWKDILRNKENKSESTRSIL